MLKKFISMFIITVYVFSMTGCGEKQNAADGAGLSATSEQAADGENLSASSDEKSVNASSTDFSIPYQPVSAAGDTFIVQDESTERYGLVDDMGNEILPCKYGDMYYLTVNLAAPKLYLAVQDKGSYGVYDLEGNSIIKANYNSIQSATYGNYFIAEQLDKYGLLDLEGNELLGMEYEDIAVSINGNIAVSKIENESFVIQLFDNMLMPISSWSVDIPGSSDLEMFKFSENTDAICVQEKIPYSSGSYSVEAPRAFDFNGNELDSVAAYNATLDSCVYPYLAYVREGQIRVKYIPTNTEVWAAPINIEGNATTVEMFQMTNFTQGETSFIIEIVDYNYDPYRMKALNKHHYIVTVGQEAVGFCAEEIGILNYPRNYSCSPNLDVKFYDGTAFSFGEENNLFLIDTAGNIVSELEVTFSDINKCYFLNDCAVLNNNGYIYVVDKNGETILSEDGYTAVEDSFVMGLKNIDGTYDVIDGFGNLIIPSESGITEFKQVQTTAEAPNLSVVERENYDDYCGLIYDRTTDEYHLYNSSKDIEIGTPEVMEGDFADALFQGNGFLLCNNENTNLYAVANLNGEYEVRLLPSM